VSASHHCADVRGYLAGEDAARARELELAFLDPETSGVICMKGGYGAPRILDRLDYALVAAHPKVFLGYSDITALHIAFLQEAGLVTFHGPMPSSDMIPEFDEESRSALEGVLFGDEAPAAHGTAFLPGSTSGGAVEGELVGGNLSLIVASMGTPWELDVEGKLLFIEDVDEAPYRIDRMLNQLRLAGKFEACAGVVAGAWTRCDPPEGARSLSIDEILMDMIAPSGKPLLTGVKAGHCAPALTLPLGVRYRMDPAAGFLTMIESPFAD
jgi:muramoyltetrapeptide carboxypeptidase